MAELAVLNIAKSLLPQLSTLAKDELLLWYNSKSELEKLENTIRTIKDVLHDAEQKQASNNAVRGWLSRLQDEMYKADDLFDTISTRALRKRIIRGSKVKKEMKIFFSKSNHLVFIVETAYKVKELRGRLDDIAKDITQFGFIRTTIEDERRTIKGNAQHSYIPEDEVIGRDKDKEELIRLLLADAREEERVSVIAVVGIGGQGKTALAQLLYNAKEIEEFFEERLWACVNDFSDLEGVLEKIVKLKITGLDELQKALRAKIQGKRFLLVIDDVWDDIREHWLRLKLLLDACDRGSKILLTTRLETVAQNLATVRPHYALGELSEEDAWILFKKMAFDSSNEEENKGKEEVGRQIVNKCPKVPLAIQTIASFLYNKDMKQWSAFVDNELVKIIPKRENLIMQVLKISYDDLPSSIKQCFAYCSVFPKDYKFDKTTLIHLWMAQGLLETSDENPCLEDVGESYFLYLLQRCFFQNVIEDYHCIVNYKMHDLFFDLAVQIAGNDRLTVTKIPDDFQGKFPRHVHVGEIKGSLLQCTGLRSLVSPNTGFVERALLDGIMLNLTSLRTLSMRDLDTGEIPNSIGKLVHLRYLDLMNCKMLNILPNSIFRLQNLLILRLDGCLNLVKLPDELQKLISLRYLEIKGCDKLNYLPSRLENMTSLVMLDRLIVSEDHAGLRCLKHRNNLTGTIRIVLPRGQWKNHVEDAKESMLVSKTKLSGLSIRWSFTAFTSQGEKLFESDAVFESLQPSNNIKQLKVEGFPGVIFPCWLSSLCNLVKLTLNGCSRCPELTNLRHLLHLKSFKLAFIPLVEYVENVTSYDSKSFFPSLESLKIWNMESLKEWCKPVGEEQSGVHEFCFPQLSLLFVSSCPQLKSLPLCPFVETVFLKDVHVNLVTQLVRVPVEEEGNSSVVPSSNIPHTCSKLSALCLQMMNDLAFLPDELKHLPSLRHLMIFDCHKLKFYSLLYSLQHLSTLESLWVRNSNEAELLINDGNMVEDGMPWKSLTRLKILGFEFGSDLQGARLLQGLHHLTRLELLELHGNLPNDKDMEWRVPLIVKHLQVNGMDEVVWVSMAIQRLSNLQSLVIVACKVDEHELDKLPWEDFRCLTNLRLYYLKMMKSLPDKCRHLLALEDLQIFDCAEIASLPDWVNRLISLEIEDCPKLKDKCRKPIGSYWPLIQDIPYFSIRG